VRYRSRFDLKEGDLIDIAYWYTDWETPGAVDESLALVIGFNPLGDIRVLLADGRLAWALEDDVLRVRERFDAA